MIEEVLGFTVVYDTYDGKVGYIGIDDHSGGYPYFSDNMENRNLFDDMTKAYKHLKSIKKEMKTYYNSQNVKWHTFRIAKITRIIEDMNYSEDDMLRESILNKLNEDEIEFLRTNYE